MIYSLDLVCLIPLAQSADIIRLSAGCGRCEHFLRDYRVSAALGIYMQRLVVCA